MKTTQTYPEAHIDHITSFLPLPNINPHHVLCTSGDGTLSVFDLRKSAAVATSEDQEDELLCCTFADDSRRVCTGTQSGFVTVWKTGEWQDHIDRISPAERLRKGDEAPNIDCMLQVEDEVFVGASDGTIRRLGFRPNRYIGIIGRCEDGVTSLVGVPDQDGWIISASGTKVAFLDTNKEEEQEANGDDKIKDSDEEERKPKKKRKKSKGSKTAIRGGTSSAFFADL